jgi:hypothetical protein
MAQWFAHPQAAASDRRTAACLELLDSPQAA